MHAARLISELPVWTVEEPHGCVFRVHFVEKDTADRTCARKHAGRLLQSSWSISRNNTAFTFMIRDRQISHDHLFISQGWTK
jgi:hypothetical protein